MICGGSEIPFCLIGNGLIQQERITFHHLFTPHADTTHVWNKVVVWNINAPFLIPGGFCGSGKRAGLCSLENGNSRWWLNLSFSKSVAPGLHPVVSLVISVAFFQHGGSQLWCEGTREDRERDQSWTRGHTMSWRLHSADTASHKPV